MRYMRENMPENQVERSAFKRLPNPEKACSRMPCGDVLQSIGEEKSCFNLFVSVYIV